MSTQIYSITWTQYISYCYSLADLLKKHIHGNTIIVTMPRGGYIPSSIISYKLDISKIFSCGYQSYVGMEKKQKTIYQYLPDNMTDVDTIFLIDDIVDTSKTVSDVMDIIKSKNPKINLYVASVLVKKKNNGRADFYIEEVPDDIWVKFPYDN